MRRPRVEKANSLLHSRGRSPGEPSVPRTMVGNVESKPHRAGILPYRGTGEPNGAPNCKAIAF
jgi:hypothetical protein